MLTMLEQKHHCFMSGVPSTCNSPTLMVRENAWQMQLAVWFDYISGGSGMA
jgi:hypothetical protein